MELIKVKTDFLLGDEVYCLTDPDQQKGLVVGIFVRPDGNTYGVSFNGLETVYYGFELSKDKVYS